MAEQMDRARLGQRIVHLLDEHWPNSGVNGWYLTDLLMEAPATPKGEGTEIRAEAFDLIPGDLVMAGDAASVIGLAIRTLNRAFDEIHKEFTANPGTTEALRLTIVLEAEVQ